MSKLSRDDRFLQPSEVERLQVLESNPQFKELAMQITGAELRLTLLKCGTWAFIPMFPPPGSNQTHSLGRKPSTLENK